MLASTRRILRQYQELGSQALARLTTVEQINWRPHPDTNSVAHIVRHLAGNMRSRWTDFLTTDGEKPNRARDEEFADDLHLTAGEARQLWEAGWACVWAALDPLTDADLARAVFIRGEAHSVQDALLRQLAHYPYHVGQLVLLAKELLGEGGFTSLSIPRNRSDAFNAAKLSALGPPLPGL